MANSVICMYCQSETEPFEDTMLGDPYGLFLAPRETNVSIRQEIERLEAY